MTLMTEHYDINDINDRTPLYDANSAHASSSMVWFDSLIELEELLIARDQHIIWFWPKASMISYDIMQIASYDIIYKW